MKSYKILNLIFILSIVASNLISMQLNQVQTSKDKIVVNEPKVEIGKWAQFKTLIKKNKIITVAIIAATIVAISAIATKIKYRKQSEDSQPTPSIVHLEGPPANPTPEQTKAMKEEFDLAKKDYLEFLKENPKELEVLNGDLSKHITSESGAIHTYVYKKYGNVKVPHKQIRAYKIQELIDEKKIIKDPISGKYKLSE